MNCVYKKSGGGMIVLIIPPCLWAALSCTQWKAHYEFHVPPVDT